jgi:hypothetical protein
MAPDTGHLVASILNAGWMVRHYARGARHTQSRIAVQRAQAIHQLGLIVRDAFSRSDDFEPLLAAVADSLRPKDEQPF